MSCKKCKKEKPIANKFHGLCLICNNKRLEASKNKSKVNIPKSKKSVLKDISVRLKRNVDPNKGVIKKKSKKTSNNKIVLDELFYEKCFHNSDHKCEECEKQLPKKFRDDNGRVLARFRYSHIVAKSIAPNLRHDENNINHLCHTCHFKWDMGDKKSMKIYEKNRLKYPHFLK